MKSYMRRVTVESPFRTTTLKLPGNRELVIEEAENVTYARACMNDCLMRGEAPFASHLLYTQRGILDDTIPRERDLGIRAGLEYKRGTDATVVYTDRGVTEGVLWGIRFAHEIDHPVEYRALGGSWALVEIASLSVDELIAELKRG